MPKNEVPCDARVADGAIRGAIVGALWVVCMGEVELRNELRGLSSMGRLRLWATYSPKMALGFTCFFGLYNGVSCAVEYGFGPGSHAGPVLAGSFMGGAIGAVQRGPRLVNMAGYSIFLGVVSYATSTMLNHSAAAPKDRIRQ